MPVSLLDGHLRAHERHKQPNRKGKTMDPIIAAMLRLIQDRETVPNTAARAYLEAHEDYTFELIAEVADRLEAEIREAVYIA